MKVYRFTENYGYHYGNLDINKKAENRKIMSGDRGTGHFGTGFYMVGTYNPEKAYSYKSRECWEIDLSAYNLYKPRSNSDAYKLHDALRGINGSDSNFVDAEEFSIDDEKDKFNELISPMSVGIEDLENLYPNENEYDLFDRWIDGDYDENEIITDDKIENVCKNVEHYMQDELNLDSYYSSIVVEQLKNKNRYRAEQYFVSALEDINKYIQNQRKSIKYLTDTFGKNCYKNIIDAINSPMQYDSKSTVFIKSLGFDGIDVTHLNHDAEGLSGLDNFGYGSVIYDLKPGTYRKIKDKE